MPQTCSICNSPDRAEIERALLSQSLRDIARQFQISKDAAMRHKKHIAAALAKSEKARDLASADKLVGIVEGLIGELEDMKTQARQKRDGPEARRTIESIFRGVTLLADLCGAYAPRVNVNIDVPSREDGIQTAAELLLDLASAPELALLIGQLQQRLAELKSEEVPTDALTCAEPSQPQLVAAPIPDQMKEEGEDA